jgi:hypothetical protein
VAPSGVPQESFDANNKDYAVVTQEIEVRRGQGRYRGAQKTALSSSIGQQEPAATAASPPPLLPQDVSAELVEGLQGTSLFLIGMMGSGKSTVGKLISQALGYCFFDTGAWVGGLFVAESRLGLLEIKSCSLSGRCKERALCFLHRPGMEMLRQRLQVLTVDALPAPASAALPACLSWPCRHAD